MEKKRNDLSIKDKIDILKRFDNLPKMSQRNAAAELKISQPLLCKIIKNRDEIENKAKLNENLNCKRRRTGKDEEVEAALKLWFANVREKDARINGPLMRQKAEDLASKMDKEDFVATDGWFNRWRKRENIVFKRTHGEENDADFPAAKKWISEEWPKIIADYSPENIYNADETGLYFRALPEHTYLFKNESSKGCKVSKERITVLCCASMTGKKKKLFVIGKSQKPRCFKDVKKLPVDYAANKTAWMTSALFSEWLLKWDKELDHNIVVLIDNCQAHDVNVTLKHIKITFLPANTTALIQPCDQGIIRAMKAYYRREMRMRVLENMEGTEKLSANALAKKTNLLQALHLLTMSWDRVSEKTIKNCFSHGGFVKADEGIDVPEFEETVLVPSDMTENDFAEWMSIDENAQVATTMTDEDVCRAVSCSIEENDEDEAEDGNLVENPPTATEMREALRVLALGVQHRGTAEDFSEQYRYESFINNLLRQKTRQATLDDFFN